MIVGGARAKVKKKIVSSPFQEKKNCKCQGAEKIKKQVTSGPEKKIARDMYQKNNGKAAQEVFKNTENLIFRGYAARNTQSTYI